MTHRALPGAQQVLCRAVAASVPNALILAVVLRETCVHLLSEQLPV